MKAALYERHGAAAEVLRGADIERPDPGPGEVRVEMSGVNPIDWKLRSGATLRAIDLHDRERDREIRTDLRRADERAGAGGITQALRDGALSELPVRRFALSDIAAAHDAVEAGEVGKVVVIPA